MQVIVHADDFGRSAGITDNMLKCLGAGIVTSVSLPANGYGYDYAVDILKNRKDLRVSIHLDLVEWKPVSSAEDIPLLVDKNGFFSNSFFSLWFRYLVGTNEKRKRMREQVAKELDAQISKIIQSFSKAASFEVNIDSHQHVHFVPFVFDALLSLIDKHHIKYIRLCNEPFSFCFKGQEWYKNYLGLNLTKHLLLKLLSAKYAPMLDKMGVTHPNYFVGVLFTGRMSVDYIRAVFDRITPNRDDVVEVLLHPCKAGVGEEPLWTNNAFLKGYYFSRFRDREMAAATDKRLAQAVATLERKAM